MKIGFDIRPLQLSSKTSGTGVVIRSLLSAISRLDRENRYYLLTIKNRPPVNLNLSDGFKYETIPLPCTFIPHLNVIRDRIFLHKEIGNHALDVIHFTNPFELKLHFDMKKDNDKTILTFYDLTPYFYSPQIFVRKRKLLEPLYRGLLKDAANAAHIISISENTRKDLIRELEVPEEKITTILLAKGPEFTVIKELKELEKIRIKYGLREKFILYVGGFGLHKNLNRLLEAVALLRSKYSQTIPLVIAGKIDKFFFSSLIGEIDRLKLRKEVLFPGYIPTTDLPAIYNLAELMIMPSLYEGFGLPVVEAMACGTPVACSNTSSLPEVAGNAAAYFNPENTQEMAHIINSILTDEQKAETMKNAGLQRSKGFTWEKTARQTIEVYHKIGGRKD